MIATDSSVDYGNGKNSSEDSEEEEEEENEEVEEEEEEMDDDEEEEGIDAEAGEEEEDDDEEEEEENDDDEAEEESVSGAAVVLNEDEDLKAQEAAFIANNSVFNSMGAGMVGHWNEKKFINIAANKYTKDRKVGQEGGEVLVGTDETV